MEKDRGERYREGREIDRGVRQREEGKERRKRREKTGINYFAENVLNSTDE